jgi:hypothetical protein
VGAAAVGLAVFLMSGGLPASAAPLPPREKKSPFQPEEVRKVVPPGTDQKAGTAHPFAAVRASLRQALPPDQLAAAEQALDRFEQQAQTPPRPPQGPAGGPGQQMEEMMERMRQRMGGMPGMGGFGMSAAQSRLGASLQLPSPTLVDQLDLPKGEGLVIQGLQKGSAASKAGVKENDILLELNGKKVPSDLGRFDELLRKIKADKKVDAVVLRKGKRETIESLSLPEAKAGLGGPGMLGGPAGMEERMQQMMERMGRPGGMPGMPPGMGMAGGMGFGGGMGGMPGMMGGGGEGVLTTIHRRGDHFTTRYQEGNLVITLTGTVDNGKAKLKEVHVQDAGSGHDYSSLEKVPERYKDKVKSLREASEKGGGTGEVETPPAKGTKPQTRLRPGAGGTQSPPAASGKQSKDQ